MENIDNLYILDGTTPVKCKTFEQWAEFYADRDKRRVAADERGDVSVSTVFLSIDHSYDGGDPVLFETMVFGGDMDGHMQRYTTYDDAVRGHGKICCQTLPKAH